MTKDLLKEALDLTVAERIELAQSLWDSIAVAPDSIELSDEQRSELAKRLQEYRDNPADAIDWEQVKSQIRL